MHGNNNSIAKIGKTTSTVRGKKYVRHTVTYYDLKTGKRERKFFNDKATAEKWAKQHKKDAERHARQQQILYGKIGDKAESLSSEMLRDAVDALELLNGRGSLTEAARIFVQDWERKQKNIPDVAQLFDTYMAESERAELREATLTDIRFRMQPLLKAYGNKRIDEITAPEVSELLSKLTRKDGNRYSMRSIRHFRIIWHGFFSFAIERGLIESNPAKSVTRTRRNGLVESTDIHIYTPEQVESIMNAAREQCPEMIAPLAIGFFAGIRVQEIKRLEWEKHIDLERSLLKITGDVAKKRSIRNVDIEKNLMTWLEIAPNKTGLVASHTPAAWRIRIKKIVNAAHGVDKWLPNGMRHSYGSYHVEKSRNPAETALQMGHLDGGGVLFEHYRQLTDPGSAAKYWKIFPEK